MRGYVENQGVDPHQWELLESARGDKIEQALYGWTEFADTFSMEVWQRDDEGTWMPKYAIKGDPPPGMSLVRVPRHAASMPWAWMVCPRGHRIIKVELNVDHNWHLYLSPAEEDTEVPASDQRVFDGVWRARQAKSVCAEPGCPTIVQSLYCDEHDGHGDAGATAENEVYKSRVRITCPGCKYAGVHKQSRLLLSFADTVANRRKSMRLRS